MGRHAEKVFEAALGQSGRGGVRTHEGDLQPFGGLTGGFGHRALVGADQRHTLLLGDQTFRLRQAVLGVALGVGVNDLELGASQVGDPRGFSVGHVQVVLAVDDLHRQVDAPFALRSRSGQVSGQGVKRADLDYLLLGQGRSGAQRQDHGKNCCYH